MATAGALGGVEGDAPATPATDDWIIYQKSSDGKLYHKNDAGTESDLTAGAGVLPVSDATSVVEGSADATKEVRFEVDGNTAGVVGVLATVFTTAKTVTFPDATDTLVGKATTDTLTNKIIADGTSGNDISFEEVAALPAVPTKVTLIATTGLPMRLFASLRDTGGTWQWVPIVKAP